MKQRDCSAHVCYRRHLPTLFALAVIRAQSRARPDRFRTHAIPTDLEGQDASDAIRALLEDDAPCMVARFGFTEARVIARYLDIASPGSFLRKAWDCMNCRIGPFWWDRWLAWWMWNMAGFFPPTPEALEQFSVRAIEASLEIDLLGSASEYEPWIRARCFPHARIMRRVDIEPFRHPRPWSEALRGKRVLVIHPFRESILAQYRKRAVLFDNPGVLPEFDLAVMKATQSICGQGCGYASWFDALDSMCEEMDGQRYDVALIGAGAYGMNLAAHAKRTGHKAIHMGGSLQLLFGIRGRRWDMEPATRALYNEHWCRPLPAETPAAGGTVEGGCYW